MKMKIKDVTAPYPRMARATFSLFLNISISYTYRSVEMVFADVVMFPHMSFLSEVSRVIGVNNAVEKKKRLTKVIRRQADSPVSIRFKNFNFGFSRISHRRKINPREFRKPMIRNRHRKWSGSSISKLWLKLSEAASPFSHNSSK